MSRTTKQLVTPLRPPKMSRTFFVSRKKHFVSRKKGFCTIEKSASPCPVCCCRSGPPAFPLGPWNERGVVLRANQARVQDAARCVPYCHPGKTSSPSGHHRWWARGQLGRRGHLPSRSRGSCSLKRQVARHHSACERCPRDRGLGLRIANAPRSLTGSALPCEAPSMPQARHVRVQQL